ncbi:hypothetical protein JKP75_19725 [Blastococcus sp. TML/M2B]|uniref:hypothetical protein n=1 Tax=unclassified Blastococcus TaxID=2619396 RepID=UPI00190BBBEE|nr:MULTISPECIES: hypothetical protein [unclassified Blastococcus]MBN1094570.1 hypothetical protein [Blastococcus sp. TML/M2B]MBN1097274.1 hypothetical protein [Blastococcus sp. TML/C7B]
MTGTRRWALPLVLLLTVLLGWAPPAAAADDPVDRVLVIGVPGLVWSDVDPAATPTLWQMAEQGAAGALSVRAARGTTCLLDGWATLGAGNRARFPGPDEGLPPVPLPTVPLPEEGPGEPVPEGAPGGDDAGAEEPAPRVDTSLSHCGLQERIAAVALDDPAATVQRTADDEGTARFGAEPAALGAGVGCAAVSGRAAALAAAAPGVQLDRRVALPTDPDELTAFLGGCDLALVSLDQLTLAGSPGADQTDDGTEPRPRAGALGRIEESLARLQAAVAALPGDTLVLLAGISEVNDGRPQLHVGIATGPGFDSGGWLRSASTGRAPYVQLIDLAPTALRALGLDVPASMNGQPLRVDGDRPELARAVTELEQMNVAATVHHRNVGAFFWIVVGVGAVLVALGLLLLGVRGRSAEPRAPVRRARALLRVLCLAVAALPVGTYLAGFVPWERTGEPLPSLVLAVLGAVVVVTAVAALGPWRRSPLGPPLVVLAVTLATLVGDVVTGSTLELNGLLGYDAIVAGRFTGYGNLSFGLLSVSALLVTAAVATAVGRRVPEERRRTVVGGVVLLAGVLTVGVIGAPSLGRDFGGVLAALPGFLLLAMLLTRLRITVLRFTAILAVAVLAVGSIAVLDWAGPAAERSHLGRFVEQVLTGKAWTVVSRKASANLDILLGSPLAWMLPVALVAAVWLVRPGGPLRTVDGVPPGGLTAADAAVLRAGLLAGALSLTLGAAVNDSGVALPATAAALLVPLLVRLAAAPRIGTPPEGEGARGAAHSGPDDDPDRVTVVSRGSTVWNA